MIVTEKHMPGPNNRWCHICGRNLNKSHARDCLYLKDTPVYHIYRATERGQIAERLTVHLPPRHTDFGWEADYTDAHGRRHTIDMEFVEEIIDHPVVVDTGAAWYSRHNFMVMETGEVVHEQNGLFQEVRKELMADKLGEAYEPQAPEAVKVPFVGPPGFQEAQERLKLPERLQHQLDEHLAGRGIPRPVRQRDPDLIRAPSHEELLQRHRQRREPEGHKSGMCNAGHRLYEDILSQARSLNALGLKDHRLVVVLGHEQARLLASYTDQAPGDPQKVLQYFNGMPVHVGPASCCAVVSVEKQEENADG